MGRGQIPLLPPLPQKVPQLHFSPGYFRHFKNILLFFCSSLLSFSAKYLRLCQDTAIVFTFKGIFKFWPLCMQQTVCGQSITKWTHNLSPEIYTGPAVEVDTMSNSGSVALNWQHTSQAQNTTTAHLC